MKNIRFCFENLFDYGTISVSSESAEFPKENLKHYWFIKHWRSMSASAQWVKIDLGEAKDIRAFIAKFHNITNNATINIQANSSDNWTNPPVNVDLLRNSENLAYIWEEAQSYRWWRLFVDDSSNPDGYIRIGRIFLGDYFEPSINFNFKKLTELRDESKLISSFGGQVSAIEQPKFKEHSYSFMLPSADIEILGEAWKTIGVTMPYFIVEDADSAPEKIYYVRNINEWGLRPLTPTWTYYEIDIKAREER